MIGKIIGGDIYVHKGYAQQTAQELGPAVVNLLEQALDKLNVTHPEHIYTIVKFSPRVGKVSFIHSPDFDTSPEPISGDSYSINRCGVVRYTPQLIDPWIYHGKHLMVGPDYPGFNVTEEAAWFNYWNRKLKMSHSRIGKRSVWEKVKPKRKRLTSPRNPPQVKQCR